MLCSVFDCFALCAFCVVVVVWLGSCCVVRLSCDVVCVALCVVLFVCCWGGGGF